jgi:hypothetical protein
VYVCMCVCTCIRVGGECFMSNEARYIVCACMHYGAMKPFSACVYLYEKLIEKEF